MSEHEAVVTETDVDQETPEADAMEQATDVVEGEEFRPETLNIPFDADEADAADQQRAVELDEDDYR